MRVTQLIINVLGAAGESSNLVLYHSKFIKFIIDSRINSMFESAALC
jgi:hypothetical protein